MSQLDGILALRNPRDLLRKLEHDFDRFKSAPPVSREAQYSAYDFFVTAEHLPEWIATVSGQSKNALRRYPEGAVVSHVANGAKHFRVDASRHTEVKDTKVHQGAFQADAFQNNAFDVPRLLIELENGTVETVLDVATRVLDYWRRA